MRQLIDEMSVAPAIQRRLDLADAGERYLAHLAGVMERKATTVQDYRIMLTRHLGPFFAVRSIDSIDASLVAQYRQTKIADGLASKTVRNHLAFLHGLFAHAVKQRWASFNPVAAIDKPPVSPPNPDIRFLTREELEALLRAANLRSYRLT